MYELQGWYVCGRYDVVETRAKKIQPSDIEACIFQNARAKVNALEIVHVLFNAAADRV